MQSFWREKRKTCKIRLKDVNNREKNCFGAVRILAATKYLEYLGVSDVYSKGVSPFFPFPVARDK